MLASGEGTNLQALIDAGRGEPVAHRTITRFARVEFVELEDGRRDPRTLGSIECAHAGLVRRDGHDRESRVEQRLEVRALA